jgi:hypothetical protein
MIRSLRRVFEAASDLDHDGQEWLAWAIFELIKSEREWDESFAGSRDRLRLLADAALHDYREKRTKRLEPDNL